MTDKLFIVLHDDKLYITSGGLSFTDFIYAGDFIASPSDKFYIEFDVNYILPVNVSTRYSYEVLPVENIPENLIN